MTETNHEMSKNITKNLILFKMLNNFSRLFNNILKNSNFSKYFKYFWNLTQLCTNVVLVTTTCTAQSTSLVLVWSAELSLSALTSTIANSCYLESVGSKSDLVWITAFAAIWKVFPVVLEDLEEVKVVLADIPALDPSSVLIPAAEALSIPAYVSTALSTLPFGLSFAVESLLASAAVAVAVFAPSRALARFSRRLWCAWPNYWRVCWSVLRLVRWLDKLY